MFTAGACLVRGGDPVDWMAIVAEGQVSLEWSDGRQRIVSREQTFGEARLVSQAPSDFTAIAQTETTLWVLQQTDWEAAYRPPAEGFQGTRPREKRSIPHSLPSPATPAVSPKPEQIPFAQTSDSAESSKEASSDRQPERRRLRKGLLVALACLTLAALILAPQLWQVANRALLRLALQSGKPELAQAYLGVAVHFLPNMAPSYNELGYALYTQGKMAEALVAFDQATTLDPELAAAQNNLGVTLLSQAQIQNNPGGALVSQAQAALEHLRAAAELDPGNAAAYLNLGDASMTTGDLEAAAQAYQRAFELDPTQIEAQAAWASILLKQGQLEAARQAWEQVLAQQPRDSLAQRSLGAIAVLEGQPTQALPYLEAAHNADPLEAGTLFYLGLALEALDRRAEAAAAFEQALELSHDPELGHLAKAHLQEIQP